jgi:hypothetical protein
VAQNFLGFYDGEKIRKARSISQQERDECHRSIGILNRFLDHQELITIFDDNYNEIISLSHDFLQRYKNSASDCHYLFAYGKREFNRRLANFLSSAITFLDHTRHSLVGKYGKDSCEVKTFEKSCHEHYDGSLAYRLMYGLRNYIQHSGMPPWHIYVLEQNSNGPNRDGMLLSVKFDRDELLYRGDKLKRELREEIAKLSSQVDVIEFVTEFKEQANAIWLDVERMFDDGVRGACILIRGLVYSMGGPMGWPYIYSERISTDGKVTMSDAMAIPISVVSLFLGGDVTDLWWAFSAFGLAAPNQHAAGQQPGPTPPSTP